MKISCLIFQAVEGEDDFAFPFVNKRAIVDVDINELVSFHSDFGIWVIPDGETEAVCILKKNLRDFKYVNDFASLIAESEERGAKWALEQHGHGLFSITREQYAKNICEANRNLVNKSKVII